MVSVNCTSQMSLLLLFSGLHYTFNGLVLRILSQTLTDSKFAWAVGKWSAIL